MIKKEFSFDEEKDAEKIIHEGFPSGVVDSRKMYLVAKYFREKMKYGAVRLERELIRFCKDQDKNFNPVKESDLIKKWVSAALKYDLRKVDSVNISNKEIEFIKSIEDLKHRKLLFVSLVFAKALKQKSTKKDDTKEYENCYLWYSNFPDIIKLSKFSGMIDTNLSDIFYEYPDDIILYSPEKELIKLAYADKDGAEGVIINNLQNVSEEYEKLFGLQNGICCKCGDAIIKTGNKKKYCDTCSVIIKREKTRARVQKHRNVTQ